MADHSSRVYESILEMLPSVENPSPLVRLNRLVPEGSGLWAKLEWQNPFGSVKDRAASSMIERLEAEGKIAPGKAVVEPTSGNTGLSLAAIANAKGYRMRAVVPNKVPLEKKALLKLAGAELDVINDNLCPSPGMGDGAIGMARTHAKAQPDKYVMPNQYENDANVQAHIRTTGPEIWRQTQGKVTHLFTSLGTCGTVTGCATYLKQQNPKIKIVAVQPSEGHDVPGIRNKSELHVTKLFDESLVDEVLEIDYEKAYTAAMELAQREGLLAGPSSGLIFEGARLVAARDGVPHGVMIFCDNIFKYMSSMMKHVPALKEGTEA